MSPSNSQKSPESVTENGATPTSPTQMSTANSVEGAAPTSSDSSSNGSTNRSPRAKADEINPNDPCVEAGFDPLKDLDRGRESSNGGYLAEDFDSSELNPPLAPGAHRYVGQHEPLDFDSELTSSQAKPQGGKNADN